MSRTLATAYNAAVDDATVRIAFLAQLEFPSGTLYVWTGVGDLSWGAQTWTGVGTFGGISDISEAAGIEAPGVDLELSGTPSATLALALADDYQGHPVKVYQALFDAAGAVIVDPVLVFSGRMDVMQITDAGETGVISLSCESESIDLDRKRVLRYTHEEQQRLFAGDLGLEFVTSMQDKPIYWSVASQAVRTPPPQWDPDDYGTDPHGRTNLP